MNRLSKAFVISSLLLVAAVASGYVIKEGGLDTDFSIFVNDGGTPKEAIKVTGSTGAVTLGASGDTVRHTGNGASLDVRVDSGSPAFRLNRNGTQAFWLESAGTDNLTFYNGAGSTQYGSIASGVWSIGVDFARNFVNGSMSLREGAAGSTSTQLHLMTGSSAAPTGSPFIQSSDGANAQYGIAETGTEGGHLIIGARETNARSIFFVTGTPTRAKVGEINESGAWLIGPTGGATHVIQGFVRMDETLGWSFGSQRPGMFFANTNGGAGSTCTANCSSTASTHGFGGGGEVCMHAWTAGNAVSACGTTLVSGKCLCVAID